jgi:predicted RNA-binding Zn-ribbon protein involved in translation (DUF1610 family)
MHSAGLLGDNAQVCAEGTETWYPISLIKPSSAESHLIQTTSQTAVAIYVCPRCGSSDIQSVPLVYEAGTSTSISKGHVIGLAGLGTDNLTPLGGVTTTRHRQQTLLAARYSPPPPQTASNDATALLFILVFSLSGFGTLILTMWSENLILASFLILGGLLTLIPAIKAFKSMQAKQKELTTAYAKKLKEWQDSFVCQKCGYFGSVN